MTLKYIYLSILLSITCRPDVSRASSNDIGFTECISALSKAGEIISTTSWKTYPTPKVDPELDEQDPSIETWTARRLSFLNKNGMHTVIEDVKTPHDELDEWNITLVDGDIAKANISVYAEGIGISKMRSSGVNGLYFCGPGGISNEWSWDGTTWTTGK